MTRAQRQHFGKKYNATGTVGRAPQRPNCGTRQSFEVRGESLSRRTIGSRPVVELVFNDLWPRGLRHGARDVEQAFVGKCLALVGFVGQREVQPPRIGTFQGSMWLPKKALWSSNEWTGSEDASSSEYYQHNVDNLALEVVGQNWSSEVISLF